MKRSLIGALAGCALLGGLGLGIGLTGDGHDEIGVTQAGAELPTVETTPLVTTTTTMTPVVEMPVQAPAATTRPPTMATSPTTTTTPLPPTLPAPTAAPVVTTTVTTAPSVQRQSCGSEVRQDGSWVLCWKTGADPAEYWLATTWDTRDAARRMTPIEEQSWLEEKAASAGPGQPGYCGPKTVWTRARTTGWCEGPWWVVFANAGGGSGPVATTRLPECPEAGPVTVQCALHSGSSAELEAYLATHRTTTTTKGT